MKSFKCSICNKLFYDYTFKARGYCSKECTNIGRVRCYHYSLPKLKDWEIGYIAGILDGEGCIGIFGKQRFTTIVIVNTHRPLIDWIRIKLKLPEITTIEKTNRLPAYKIIIRRKMTIKPLLIELLPYLIVKKKKAKEMLALLKKY